MQKSLHAARFWIVVLLFAAFLTGCSFQLNPYSLNTSVIDLSLNEGNVTFNDISYDTRLERVIVPAAETGNLALVDPETHAVKLIPGFSKQISTTEAEIGATSAASARGMIFVIDRFAKKINIVDPALEKIIGSVDVQDTPDSIRFVSATNELWVVEKAKEQIEVFRVIDGEPVSLESVSTIPVPNGPESLLIDRKHGLAFTNQPKIGMTAVIQVMTHSVIAQWGNGCSKARGLAMDEDRGLLFVACEEGKLVVMDTNNDGFQITSANYGGGLSSIAYNPQLQHIYVPSGDSAIMAVFEIKDNSAVLAATTAPSDYQANANQNNATPTPVARFTLFRKGTADTSRKANCITVDDQNNVWVCDPVHGKLFSIRDTFVSGY